MKKKTTQFFVLAAMMTIAMPMKAGVNKTTAVGDHIFYGTIIDSYSGSWEGPGGLYSVMEGDPYHFELKAKEPRAYGGGTYGNHKFYAINYTENEDGTLYMPLILNVFNGAMGWSLEKQYGSFDFTSISSDLTFDPKSGRMYGCFYDEDYRECKSFGFIEMDQPDTHYYQSHIIGYFPERMVAMATNADGVMYSIGESGMLYTVNKITGEVTEVASTGLALSPFYQSAVCDQTTGDIFFSASWGDFWDTSIFKIDPATAKATNVVDTSYDNYGNDEQVTGLFLLDDITGSATPMAPAGFEVNYPAKSLSGTISFTLPTHWTDDSAVSGSLDYAVMANGHLVQKGQGTPGERISFNHTFETAALYDLQVSAMQNNSASNYTSCHIQIGEEEITPEPVVITPETVTDFTVVPADKGALSATLTFTAPSTDTKGESLTAPLEVSITRNSLDVTTLSGIEPGSTVTYTDDSMLFSGSFTYRVSCTLDGETGAQAAATCYVGLDAPGAIQNLRAREDFNHPGTVVLTWDAPTEGQHGGYIEPEKFSYYVSYGTQGEEAYVGSDRTFRDPLDISKGQVYQAYSVYAVNDAGSGRSLWKTIVALVGDPYPLPYSDSFPGITMNNGSWLPQIVTGETGEAWWNVSDGSVLGSDSQDGDGGMFEFSAQEVGKASRISSPRVDISKAAEPQLSFWNYYTGEKDQLELDICVDDNDYIPVKTIVADEQPIGWHRVTVDLSPYKDSRFVKVGFVGRAVENTYNCLGFDNIIFSDAANADLQAEAFTGPESIKVGEEGTFRFVVRNLSEEEVDAQDYTVVLSKNGHDVQEANGRPLNVGETASFTLTDEASSVDGLYSVYTARIETKYDSNLDNNTSEPVKVEVLSNNYPAPTALAATFNGQAQLTWGKPDFLHQAARSYTENFDFFTPFITDNIGEWITVDADNTPCVYMMLDATFGALEYPGAGERMAYQVFNSLEAGIPFSTWDPHSGDNMLLALKCASPDNGVTEIANDDWLISPELDGTAQTISFYAKAGMNGSYIPETYEFLYSTGSTDPQDFVLLATCEISNVKGWEKQRYDVPEGAKRFAIRHTSLNKLAFLMDDITYIPEGAEVEALDLLGYNVYRADENGTFVRMNVGTVGLDATFDDPTAVEGETYTYCVTAVYEQGEGQPSAPLTVLCDAAGITIIPAAVTDSYYYNIKGQRFSAPQQGVNIHAGRKVLR